MCICFRTSARTTKVVFSLSTWQKFEYIEFGCVCRSKKHVWDFLKTLLDQWLSPSPMLQDFYRFNVYIFMFTNEIRPYRPLQTDVRYALCRAGGCPRCWSPKISWREMPFQSPSVFYKPLLHLQVGWNRPGSEVRVSLQSSWFDFRRDKHTALYAKRACSRNSPARL